MAASKVILITGANSGIGYEALKVFLNATKPYHILAAARTAEKAQAAVEDAKREAPDSKNTIEPIAVDVTSDSSIQQAYQQVQQSPGRLDALINNAGASFDIEHLRGNATIRETFNKAYDVNVSGANVMAHTFMPLLMESSDPKLLFVAGLSSITLADKESYFPGPPPSAGWPKQTHFETIGYRCSKVALNMLTLDWAYKTKDDPLKVWGVGPGFLVTNLGGIDKATKEKMGCGHASEGGQMYLRVLEGEYDQYAGKVIEKAGLLAL